MTSASGRRSLRGQAVGVRTQWASVRRATLAHGFSMRARHGNSTFSHGQPRTLAQRGASARGAAPRRAVAVRGRARVGRVPHRQRARRHARGGREAGGVRGRRGAHAAARTRAAAAERGQAPRRGGEHGRAGRLPGHSHSTRGPLLGLRSRKDPGRSFLSLSYYYLASL